jgi:low affinity Fe/Cu permease
VAKRAPSDRAPGTHRVADLFRRFAHTASQAVGSPWAFLAAVVVVLGWAVMGPIFGFSNTWQLVINTGTTIVTFLMVFLIQNTQNRDGRAMQLKLDELIKTSKRARNSLIDLEDMSDEDLDGFQKEFSRYLDRRRKSRRGQ